MNWFLVCFLALTGLAMWLNIWLGVKEGQIAERSEDKE